MRHQRTSGSDRLLTYVGKRTTPEMTRPVVRRLTARGISVKGYFILGFPTGTRKELPATVRLVHGPRFKRHEDATWPYSGSTPGRADAAAYWRAEGGNKSVP